MEREFRVYFECERCKREMVAYYEEEDYVDTLYCGKCMIRYKVFRPVIEERGRGGDEGFS